MDKVLPPTSVDSDSLNGAVVVSSNGAVVVDLVTTYVKDAVVRPKITAASLRHQIAKKMIPKATKEDRRAIAVSQQVARQAALGNARRRS